MTDDSNSQVAQLKGLGPKSSEALRAIGVETVEQLRASDRFDLYSQLKALRLEYKPQLSLRDHRGDRRCSVASDKENAKDGNLVALG
jgi:hypothetical protein